MRVPGSAPLFGFRPQLSADPPAFAPRYEWLSWDAADARRQAIGSGLAKLFDDGVAGGDPLRAFGIYSGNCPGAFVFVHCGGACGLTRRSVAAAGPCGAGVSVLQRSAV